MSQMKNIKYFIEQIILPLYQIIIFLKERNSLQNKGDVVKTAIKAIVDLCGFQTMEKHFHKIRKI